MKDGFVTKKDTKAADSLLGVKTGYGELEGFFGGGRLAGSSVGVYYNDFFGKDAFKADDLWGAFASFNFGSKWNLTANYEKISKDQSKTSVDDPEMWYGKLQYGTASFAAPKSWDAWVEYLDAEDGAYLNGSTNFWRWDNLDNIKTWGVGVDYTFAKNAMFSVMQSFATDTKKGNDDTNELTRAQFVFVF